MEKKKEEVEEVKDRDGGGGFKQKKQWSHHGKGGGWSERWTLGLALHNTKFVSLFGLQQQIVSVVKTVLN